MDQRVSGTSTLPVKAGAGLCYIAGVLALAAAMLASGCGSGGGGSTSGGGGGGGGTTVVASLSVSPDNVAVSVASNTAAPTALIQATITSTATASFYIGVQSTNNGIASLDGAQSGNDYNITLTFMDPATLGPGSYSDTVTVTVCYDQACARQITNSPQVIPVTYTVTAAGPVLTSLSPTSVTAGAAAFTLTVNGSLFTPNSVVEWNGSQLTTSFVSANQLTAQVGAAQVSAAGTFLVTVVDGSSVSNALDFTVDALPPFTVTAISPSHVNAAGPGFNVTVLGNGFTAASSVTWNGTALQTTYVNGTKVRAGVPAALIASAGTAQVAVVNPVDQGGTSAALPLTIDPATLDAVAFQMNANHSGVISFNATSLPSTSLWSVDVGGPASYALIARGRVYVTVVVGGNSELLALDATTGATIWGPIAFAGAANAAYENGLLFVTSGSSISTQLLTAVDADTGASKWSSTVLGQWFPAPPVALGGHVYSLTGGWLSVFDETNGATLWNVYVSGSNGTMAVTADGVYTAAPCTTYDLLPLDGSVIWYANTGCSGGGGSTPVVAGGSAYSPIDGTFQGIEYDAGSGAVISNFSAGQLPAVTDTTAFFLANSTLQGIRRSDRTILWSFAGDGTLDTAPVVVNNYVFVGSANGNLYALDATTGSQVWTQALGSAIYGSPCCSYQVWTGLAAGNGLLVVPAGNSVTTYQLSTNP